MYHYVYLLQNIDDLRYYIGARSSSCIPTEDVTYLSSSKTVTKSYKQRCVKYILQSFSTRKEAINYEIYLHNLYEVHQNRCFFNKAKQTSIGFDTSGLTSSRKGAVLSDETKQKLRLANLGKKQSQTTCDKRANSLKGKSCSLETRAKIGKANSLALLGRKKPLEEKFANVTNHNVYTFIHTSGIVETCLPWSLIHKYTLNKSHISQLIKNKRHSHKGWTLKQGP